MFDTMIGRIALILIFVAAVGASLFVMGKMMDSRIGRLILGTLWFSFIAAFLGWVLWLMSGAVQETYCERHSPDTTDARFACRDKYGV